MMPNPRSPNPSEPHQALREWYASLLGQSMLPLLRRQVEHMLHGVFGYHGLQVGLPQVNCNLLEGSGLYHTTVLDTQQVVNGCHFIATPETLPVASNRLDLLLLLHTLDFSADPHGILREAERALSNDGFLVVVGFNPWGAWGGLRQILRWRREGPWKRGFYSVSRTQDWLSLLGFRVLESDSFYFRPPLQHPGVLQKLQFMEGLHRWFPKLGAVYVIKARKMSVPLTPLRSRWRPRRRLAAAGMIRPANLDSR